MICPNKRTAQITMLTLCVLLAGCTNTQRRADRAFEAKRYSDALELYDEAIAAGNRDPMLFYNAARASLSAGDLAGAERYYSRSLDLGASNDVAWELANFYVSTSNYVSAVRVYRYLLYRESDKQPVYNNLGTALMYAGLPFDAESYLMVAQHMDPLSPSPYLNLGLLYDRHLRQPWLAVNFYECYDELTRGRAENTAMVRQRSAELRDRYYRLYQRGAVECGVEYQPSAPTASLDAIRTEFPVEDEQAADKPKDEPPPVELNLEGTQPDEPVTVETTAPTLPPDALDVARAAFDGERWADTVAAYGLLPMSRLATDDFYKLGVAYREQANFPMAIHWLELARASEPTPQSAAALLATYAAANRTDRTAQLCVEIGNDASYQEVVATYCNLRKEE